MTIKKKTDDFTSLERPGNVPTSRKSSIVMGLKNQWNQHPVRVTLATTDGLYIFSLLEEPLWFVADYLYYPHRPLNEKLVNPLVASFTGDYSCLFQLLLHWSDTSSYGGYNLTKQ